jgi:Ca2+-binding RTX toxin-like protein
MADVSETIFTAANVAGIAKNGGIVAGTYSGELDAVGDRDWVRVQFVAGQQYQIFVSLAGSSNDSQMALRDPAGNQILIDDDSGAGQNSYTAFTALVSGAYFIDVGAFGGNATGSYSVAVINNTSSPGVLKLLDNPSESYQALANERVLGGDGNDTMDAGVSGKDLVGEQGNDVLSGNDNANTLVGGIGNDTIFGLGGMDVLIGDAGDDNLFGSVLFDAPGVADAAADTMIGGAGNDSYIDPLNDTIIEREDEGVDRIVSDFSVSLLDSQSIELVELTGEENTGAVGNASANGLAGNDGNNRLEGRGGADTLVGGLGNDVYVNPQGDVITELANEGTDRVQTGATFSLASSVNVEEIALTGSANVNASGNAAANRLFGNIGNNILNGGVGTDTMIGGAGNDIYYVDHAGDVTTENGGEGTDLVSSSVSRTLSAHIENLNLSGAANIDGNGNTGANRINGNAGNNILRGYEGADTLNGGGGNDILSGGTASDSLNPGSDAVRDIIRFSAVGDSTGSQRDIITGLDLTNEDRLDFTVVPTALVFVGSGALNLATINADLAAAVDGALAVNGAVLFDPTSGDMNVSGHLFVVVDANGDGIYKPNQDYVVQLVNSTGFLTLDDFI